MQPFEKYHRPIVTNQRLLPVQRWAVLLVVQSILPFLGLALATLALLMLPAPLLYAQQLPDPNDEIVFIDSFGVIRVLDVTVLGRRQIEWYSPENDFQQLAVGDVNNDGDYEIIAIRGNNTNSKLVVYDPVINSATVGQDGQINGVPWKKLYEQPLGFAPTLLETGELDIATAGDEILYGIDMGNGSSRLVILKAANAEGTNWLAYRNILFRRVWDDVAVGEIADGGPEELILSDDKYGDSLIAGYRLQDDSLNAQNPFYVHSNSDKLWEGAVIGQVYPGDYGEVVVIRDTSPEGPENAFIFQYYPDEEVDKRLQDKEIDSETPNQELDDGFFFNPRPKVVFLADINGNGDEEIFFLRSTIGSSIRLLMRNRGDDAAGDNPLVIANIEQVLDTDNGYRGAAGGDVDGDGKDEIVIIRNNRMRIYLEPDKSMSIIRDDTIVTDSKNIRIADLDANGFSVTN